jgi:hypothetical protein
MMPITCSEIEGLRSSPTQLRKYMGALQLSCPSLATEETSTSIETVVQAVSNKDVTTQRNVSWEITKAEVGTSSQVGRMNLAMLTTLSATPRRILSVVAALLILKVTGSVLLNYGNYFPPNFDVGFLRGREAYFAGGYHWAFYAHIVSGPLALMLGLVLLSEHFRRRLPKWHRVLGRMQVLGVLLFVTPSGLWMAYHAESGPIAACGFAALAIATAICMVMGWRSAIQRRFSEHRRWMWRSFLLLSSAVVLRVVGGLATVTGVGALWIDQVTPWACWLVPLAVFELCDVGNRLSDRPFIRSVRPSA